MNTLWTRLIVHCLPVLAKALPLFQLVLQSVQRGPLSTARSQALINERVRAVTQKALTEEQPCAKLPPTRGRGEQQRLDTH